MNREPLETERDSWRSPLVISFRRHSRAALATAALVLLLAAAVGITLAVSKGNHPEISKTIAVLPFENDGADPSGDIPSSNGGATAGAEAMARARVH